MQQQECHGTQVVSEFRVTVGTRVYPGYLDFPSRAVLLIKYDLENFIWVATYDNDNLYEGPDLTFKTKYEMELISIIGKIVLNILNTTYLISIRLEGGSTLLIQNIQNLVDLGTRVAGAKYENMSMYSVD